MVEGGESTDVGHVPGSEEAPRSGHRPTTPGWPELGIHLLNAFLLAGFWWEAWHGLGAPGASVAPAVAATRHWTALPLAATALLAGAYLLAHLVRRSPRLPLPGGRSLTAFPLADQRRIRAPAIQLLTLFGTVVVVGFWLLHRSAASRATAAFEGVADPYLVAAILLLLLVPHFGLAALFIRTSRAVRRAEGRPPA